MSRNFPQLLSRNKPSADVTASEYCCGHFSFHVCCLSTSVWLGGKPNVIASRPGLLTLEDYLLATDLLPALIFIFMAGLFGFLPSSLSSAATKVSRGDKNLFLSPLVSPPWVDMDMLSYPSAPPAVTSKCWTPSVLSLSFFLTYGINVSLLTRVQK